MIILVPYFVTDEFTRDEFVINELGEIIEYQGEEVISSDYLINLHQQLYGQSREPVRGTLRTKREVRGKTKRD